MVKIRIIRNQTLGLDKDHWGRGLRAVPMHASTRTEVITVTYEITYHPERKQKQSLRSRSFLIFFLFNFLPRPLEVMEGAAMMRTVSSDDQRLTLFPMVNFDPFCDPPVQMEVDLGE